MTIDDDFYDIEDTLRKTDTSRAWDRFSNRFSELENDNDELRKANNELRTAMRVMMKLKDG